MNRKLIRTLLVMAAAGFAACTDDVGQPAASDDTGGYYFIIDSYGPQSRVTYGGETKAAFDDGDEFGAFAIDEHGAAVSGEKQNAHYRVKTAKSLGGTGRQVLDPVSEADRLGQGYDRYLFYYPYSPAITSLDDMKAYAHMVWRNQNSQNAYEASDLLWDVAAPDRTQNCVNIAMDHAMAQIIVKIDEEFVDTTEAVSLSGMPGTASDMDLTTESVRDLRYTAENPADIAMWNFGYASSGALLFRAVVAACTTLPRGATLLSLTTSSGEKKSYTLKEDLTLEPGKNYIFTLKKNVVEIPEVDDTDSWVLDVLDPETGKPVGLLCREYLHYVDPAGITDTDEPYTGTDYGDTKNVNSQAWVFYNLRPGTDIPDLDKGTVLQFVYDIRDVGFWPWPAPHINKRQKGIFAPRHGWKWGGTTADGKYGCELPGSEKQYYMHGGTVIWDGENNRITYFQMPAAQITNAQAAKGYISIDRATGEVGVSYREFDAAVEKQGVIVPHMLIDRRVNKTAGTLDIRKYPIVKIGYNQFWMSMSLRTQYMCDGTPLQCYNKKGAPGVTFNDGDLLSAGFIFPFNKSTGYDPYNNLDQRSHPESIYTPTRLYNKPTVDNPKFLPASPDANSYYIMPGRKEINNFLRYVNPRFATKMASKYVGQYIGDYFAYGALEMSLRGESGFFSDSEQSTYQNAYTCNVSGFNLRPLGNFEPMSSFNYCTGLNNAAYLILNSADEPDAVLTFVIQNYNPFEGGQTSEAEASYYPGMTNRITERFAQVRFVMKYRSQADTQGRAISTSGRSKASCESRDVYVSLAEE